MAKKLGWYFMTALKNESAKAWVRDADAFLEMCRTTKPDPDDPYSSIFDESGECVPEYDSWRASAEKGCSDLLKRMKDVQLIPKIAASYMKKLGTALEPDSARPIYDTDVKRGREARERVFRKNPPPPLEPDFEV